MPPVLQQGPINLTEAAVRMPWSEVDQALRVRAQRDGLVLEIRGLSHAVDGHMNLGVSETVYVIVSGYGVLHCEEMAMDCTKDDVLYVPSGHPHHFERLDGEIRIWRISLVPRQQAPEDALSGNFAENDPTLIGLGSSADMPGILDRRVLRSG